ncbi:UDP-4-amino-4,6-dideoxy-N-acetyl-beta-L-altrosamine transaminase [Candidatus Falkowbacteria bacterium CG_4_9_14_3_um_filter_38_19]|uniref:UDP-4-amino-4, 6-dideoxy-N-acetyl-beta-L-altrosamine transaminase n=1 Tax=Candidatus Falkowbacteria bacterium CG_4_9_14_3_um_filter_38_19 TaxID=1974559 RepID=A0A2M8ALQ6_9BACT|nr:MAG: UDP-4-amino-4,6-dideoxy-N-acetyl-beta-L-altrosamine transaminase [Candidatus Falkowbacteria bacterium CG_4_9_14_3_um_filter_38_19]
MRKKFLPFTLPDITKKEISAVSKVLKSGWLTTGLVTQKFEKNFAKFIGVKYAVAVNSGTAALHLALDAIGLKSGEEVIVPTLTFTATAEVVTYFGAKPVFVDCKEDTFNIDPKKIEEKITKKTKAIIPVHIGGQACDMDEILKLAKKYNLKIIEDAAHALPSEYKGKMIGTISDITCFSFYPTKPITTGEGGMVTTNNKNWAERIEIMRLHGISHEAWNRYSKGGSWYYQVLYPGWKYNPTDVASALGIEQLKRCDLFYRKRKEIAQIYTEAFRSLKEIQTPYTEPFNQHAWHLYIIKLNLDRLTISRDRFIEEMRKRNIGISVHFIPLHLQPAYKKYGYKVNDFLVANKVFQKIVSLPIYSKMTEQDVKDAISVVKDIVKKYRKKRC